MRFPCVIAVLTTLTVPLLAEQTDRSGWQYDAVMPDHLSDTSSPTAGDINAINDLLAKLRDSWNVHNLDSYLALYWNSPQLLVVIGDEQAQGWQALRDSYRKSYPDSKMMGAEQYSRIQIKFSKPDLALAKTTWSRYYPNSNGEVLGDTTLNLQKFPDGWKVISAYSSFVKSTSRGWEYDSIEPKESLQSPSPQEDDLKTINDLLLKMLDRWNAHDVEGYLSAYWRSPQLLVMLQEQQFQGWQSVYDTYKTGYQDPDAMGSVDPSRIQIRLVKPDVATAVTWWMVTYPRSKVRVVGNSTINLQKFSDGWKIVLLHSSYLEP
jgi:uncharacterized protein (TIGR02246 family)